MHVFSAQRWLYNRITIVVSLIFLVGGTLALLKPVGQLADPAIGWVSWIIMLGSAVFGFWGNGYNAALQGLNHIAISRRWEMLFALAQIGSVTAVLLANGGLLALVLANQFWWVMSAFRNRWLLKDLHPELFGAKPERHNDVIQVLWPAAWRSGLGSLMSQGIIQASGVIYSQIAGAAEVASYLLALRFITMISQFSQAPFYSKLPMLAQCHAKGQTSEQLRLASRGMYFSHWIFVIGAIGIAVAAGPLLKLIGSGTPFVSSELWLLMCCAFFAERLGAMYLQLYSTTNHIVWHIANGVTGVLMLGGGILLYPVMGVEALPLAMLAAYLGFYTWYAIRLSTQAFSFKWLQFERQCAMLPVLTAAACALLYHFAMPGI
ncbi:MAG: hypothetical protein QM742_08075 [Aquabacterium sp.]